MDLADDGGSRFAAYVDGLTRVIGHKDREGPLRDYCLGLMLPCERKSVEPLAAVTKPARVATIDEIAAALEWQPHTVRSTIAGALKKKLGLQVASEQDEKHGRKSQNQSLNSSRNTAPPVWQRLPAGPALADCVAKVATCRLKN